MEIIRYKFMSCATFETLNIAPHSSISLHDLKTEIVLRKGLDLHRDSLLVYSENFTVAGGELTNDDTQIHSGSGVILKRIPAESPPPDRKSAGQTGNEDDDFVNFVELHVLNVGLPDFDFEDVSWDDSEEVKEYPVERCWGEVSGETLEATFPVESNPQDSNPNAVGASMIQPDEVMAQEHTNLDRNVGDLPVGGEMLEPTLPVQCNPKDSSPNALGELMSISQGQTNLDRTAAEKLIAGRGFDIASSELKCSLCSTFFKDAVMIPCCQYSFCQHCISLALIENSTCPKCSSDKCKPEDLLPNRTLRDLIDRFLELQGLQDNVGRDAPDNASFQWDVTGFAPQHWPHNMYCGPELMAYNAMYAATTVAFSSYDSSMFSGYPVTSVGGIGPSSWMNAYQSNQTDLYSYQQGNHTEAFKRGKNLPRLSEAKEIVPNDQLDESTSEKVKHDTQKRENSLRYSKRKEEMRPQHASDSSHKNHHYSNKESIPRRRMDNDRRSYREYHGRSSSGGVECAYSSGSGRRGQDDTGPESRHSQKYSKPNGKDIYHERGQMTKYSNDDYEEDYHHSHKRKR